MIQAGRLGFRAFFGGVDVRQVLLIHWKESELPDRVAALFRAGYKVTTHSSQATGPTFSAGALPDAILIDLSRLPSHGRTYGYVFRQQKATRAIPLVFLEGDPEKVRSVRKMLPDATYTTWSGLAPALRRAIAKKSKKTVVPVSTSGYSGTPLPKKLGVDGDRSVILLHAPKGFENLIRDRDGGLRIRRGDRGQADVVIWFAKQQAELKKRLAAAKKAIAEGGAMWIAWPKKTSGVRSDLSEDAVRAVALAAGLVDYKVCAIDDTWSGLKFARRR
jgi:hypothetical protein